MDWLSAKIDALISWFSNAITTIWTAFTDFLKDFVVFVLDGVLGAISALVAAIPTPSFLVTNNLSNLFSGLPTQLIWLLHNTGVFDGFGIIAAGITFHLLRKIVTLGQW